MKLLQNPLRKSKLILRSWGTAAQRIRAIVRRKRWGGIKKWLSDESWWCQIPLMCPTLSQWLNCNQVPKYVKPIFFYKINGDNVHFVVVVVEPLQCIGAGKSENIFHNWFQKPFHQDVRCCAVGFLSQVTSKKLVKLGRCLSRVKIQVQEMLVHLKIVQKNIVYLDQLCWGILMPHKCVTSLFEIFQVDHQW